MSGVSVIVIAKNSEGLIADCMKSVLWAQEIILIDTGSSDETAKIAKDFGAKVFKVEKGNFSSWRNFGATKAGGTWLFYVDADERITPLLRDEIQKVITDDRYAAYAIPRRNILLGKELKHGGWWPDYVVRIIKKDAFKSWQGELHEQPDFSGELGKFLEPMVHISHRSLFEMMEKTNEWSEIEARLLFESGHPPMNIFRFASAGLRELWYRGVIKAGFLDGAVGTIEVFYQTLSRLITYAKLWEKQLMKK